VAKTRSGLTCLTWTQKLKSDGLEGYFTGSAGASARGVGDHNVCGARKNGESLFASYTTQAVVSPVGVIHSNQIEWVHVIYPTLLGRRVAVSTYPPIYRDRLILPQSMIQDVPEGARPLLCWQKHTALEELLAQGGVRNAALLQCVFDGEMGFGRAPMPPPPPPAKENQAKVKTKK